MGFVPDLDLAFVSTTNMDSTDAIFALAYQTIDNALGINETDWTAKVKKAVDQKIAKREQKISSLMGDAPQKVKANKDQLGDYHNPGYGLITLSENDGNLMVTIGKKEYPVIINEDGKMFVEVRLYQHQLLPIAFQQDQILLLTEPALNKPTEFNKVK